MQTIQSPSRNIMKILGKARPAGQGLRWMTYVLAQPVEGGVLVFHTLTQALLLLTPEEYAAPDSLPELRDAWFRVPMEMNDRKYADQVRFVLSAGGGVVVPRSVRADQKEAEPENAIEELARAKADLPDAEKNLLDGENELAGKKLALRKIDKFKIYDLERQ